MTDITDSNAPTSDQLAQAYAMVNQGEAAILTQIDALAKAFVASLQAIIPVTATSSQTIAQQYFTRLNSNMTTIFGYDLNNVKNTYGLNAPVVTPAAATTSSNASATDPVPAS